MGTYQPGDLVQSKTHPGWSGRVLKISKNGHAAYIDWEHDLSGHIRSWAYIDAIILVEKHEPSRYEKAIAGRKKN